MKAIPFDQFRAELLRLYGPPHRAPATRSKLKHVLDLVAALEVKTTADLTPALVARFIEARPPGQSPRTLQSLLVVLRGVCNQATVNGYLRLSPFASKSVARWLGRIGPPTERKHYSRDEIRRVLTLMAADVESTAGWSQWRSRRLQALTATVAYTGLRRTEALFLHAADINLEARFIALTDRGRAGEKRLKTEGSEQPVPIPDAPAPILADWLSHRLDAPVDFPVPLDCPWLFPTLNRRSNWTGGPPGTKPLDRLRDVAKRAGVEGMNFLSLRHSWATHAEFHGYGPALIQRVLRHTTEQTAAKWYRHADLPNLVERCAGFDF